MGEIRYWYSHAESGTYWIGKEGEDPGSDGCVVQHREARDEECNTDEWRDRFDQELKDQWDIHIQQTQLNALTGWKSAMTVEEYKERNGKL